MLVLFVLAGLVVVVWSVALAIVWTAFPPAVLAWLTASVYGPTTVFWDVGPVTLSLDRVAFFWFALFVMARFVLGGSDPGRLLRDSAFWAGVGFTLLAFVQSLWYPWAPIYPEDMPPLIRLAYIGALPLGLYAGVIAESAAGRPSRWLAGMLLTFWCFGVYLAATALAEQFGITAAVFPKHILRPRELYLGRPVGPFLSTPLLGTTLVVSLAASVLLALRARGLLRGAVLTSLPLIVAAIVATETRSVWLGCVAVGGLLLIALAGRDLRYGLLLLGAAAAIVGVVVAGSKFVNPSRIEGSQLVEFSFLQRLALMDGALTLFVQRPVFGWGFGQFERAVRVHVGGGLFGFWATGAAEGLSSHNLPLRLLAETGLVGFGLWLTVWVVWCRRAIRLWREGDDDRRATALLFLAGLLAYWSETLFHDTSFLPAGNLMTALLAAAVSAQATGRCPDATQPEVIASRAAEPVSLGVP